MVQVIPFNVHVGGGAATRFYAPANQGSPSLVAVALMAIPAAGTIRNLRVRSKTAIPATGTSTTTIWHNAGASSLAAALTSSTQEVTDTDSVSVAEGDTLEFRTVTNGTAGVHVLEVCFDFEASTADVSWVIFGGDVIGSSGSSSGLFYSSGEGGWEGVSGDGDRAGADGTITNHYIRASAAPGAGNSRIFTMWKNGVAQDGTGGTPDTRITLSGAGSGSGITFGSTTFTLSVTELDQLKVVHTTTGTPATTHNVIGSCRFLSSDAGSWNVGAFINSNPSNSATNYAWPFGLQETGTAWSATESDKQFKVGPTGFSLSEMRIDLDTAPGSGNSYVFTVRKNGAATALTLTFTDAEVADTISGVDVDFADGDLIAFEAVPSSTPTVPAGIRVVFSMAAAPIVGSAVFGVDTTVTATRAIAFGLDGATNVHDEAGKFKVFGDFEVTGDSIMSTTGLQTMFNRLMVAEDGSLVLDENGNPVIED